MNRDRLISISWRNPGPAASVVYTAGPALGVSALFCHRISLVWWGVEDRVDGRHRLREVSGGRTPARSSGRCWSTPTRWPGRSWSRARPGLARVVDAFGAAILTRGRRLDRPRLGCPGLRQPGTPGGAQRHHPSPGRGSAPQRIVPAAPAGAVVVQDIPLLVETGQGSNFHLVVVVDAPDDVRIAAHGASTAT